MGEQKWERVACQPCRRRRQETQIHTCSGHAALGEAARRVGDQLRFSPARNDSEPVPALSLDIVFVGLGAPDNRERLPMPEWRTPGTDTWTRYAIWGPVRDDLKQGKADGWAWVRKKIGERERRAFLHPMTRDVFSAHDLTGMLLSAVRRRATTEPGAASVAADVQALLRSGAKADDQDEEGRTPLHWAAMRQSDPEIARALVGAGAAPEAKDAGGRTPLEHAEGRRESGMVAVLMELMPAVTESPKPQVKSVEAGSATVPAKKRQAKSVRRKTAAKPAATRKPASTKPRPSKQTARARKSPGRTAAKPAATRKPASTKPRPSKQTARARKSPGRTAAKPAARRKPASSKPGPSKAAARARKSPSAAAAVSAKRGRASLHSREADAVPLTRREKRQARKEELRARKEELRARKKELKELRREYAELNTRWWHKALAWVAFVYVGLTVLRNCA